MDGFAFEILKRVINDIGILVVEDSPRKWSTIPYCSINDKVYYIIFYFSFEILLYFILNKIDNNSQVDVV